MSKGIIIIICLFLTSCYHEKNMLLLGFVYKHDSITVIKNNRNLFIAKITGNEYDSGLHSFYYEKIKFEQGDKNAELEIRLDSANNNLLDTIVFIPQNYQTPFISFLSPLENNSKRIIFIGDIADGFYDNVHSEKKHEIAR